MSEQIRLLASTMNNLIGMGVCVALSDDPQIDLVQVSVTKLQPLLHLYQQHSPCILLLTAPPFTSSFSTFIKSLQNDLPMLRVVLIAATYKHEYIDALLQLAAGAFVLASDTPETLRAAVRAVSLSNSWFTATVTKRYYAEQQKRIHEHRCQDATQQLTKREQEVLSLLALGLSNQQIGEKLCVSQRTVRFHTYNIYEKLNFQSRGEAIAWAIQTGIRCDS